MRDGFEKALKFVLGHEGGFSHHPHDPGGMTNLGVTRAVWEAYTGRPADEATMRGLTREAVTPLYRKRYWDSCRCDDLPDGIDLCVFDTAVNMGPTEASRILQRSIGLRADGIIGDRTIAAVVDIPADGLISDFSAERRGTYKKIRNYKTFGSGWIARANACERVAYRMADGFLPLSA